MFSARSLTGIADFIGLHRSCSPSPVPDPHSPSFAPPPSHSLPHPQRDAARVSMASLGDLASAVAESKQHARASRTRRGAHLPDDADEAPLRDSAVQPGPVDSLDSGVVRVGRAAREAANPGLASSTSSSSRYQDSDDEEDLRAAAAQDEAAHGGRCDSESSGGAAGSSSDEETDVREGSGGGGAEPLCLRTACAQLQVLGRPPSYLEKTLLGGQA